MVRFTCDVGREHGSVDEANMRKFASVEFAVLDCDRFSVTKEHASQVSIRVHAGKVSGFAPSAAKLRMHRSWKAILILLREIRNHFAHNVQQIVLQILQIKRVRVVRALQHHHRTSRVMGNDCACSVFHAERGNALYHLFGDIMKRGNPAA